MTLLYTYTHPDVAPVPVRVQERRAVRAVVIDGSDILLLYTRRYDDYSFPGGGLDESESHADGLLREMREETGATGVVIGEYLGYVDEYRPPRGTGYDVLFMRSHFYVCQADRVLGECAPETYEITNGMRPVWVNIDDAIAHNERILEMKPNSMGLSILRETEMLKHLAARLHPHTT